jgi:hypothetical protein
VGDQLRQPTFELGEVGLHRLKQRQVVVQQFAANGGQFGVRQEGFARLGNDFGRGDEA